MRRAFIVPLAGVAAIAATSPATAETTARDWLERMTRSLASLHYDGLFIHTAGSQSESMRIVHRTVDGRSVERLVSLDRSGREIVRTPEEVHFYLPDRRVVLVEPRSDDGSLLKALPAPGPQLDALYTLETSPGHRLLRRDVQIVDIRPRDGYRYGYRLWLDADTAMPLRSDVLDAEARTVESIQFTKLEIGEDVSARELEPGVDATGYQWLRPRPEAERRVRQAGWLPRKMPPGFRLVAFRSHSLPGLPMRTQHLIFSDGFASVSVFIEPAAGKGPVPPESTSVGSANAFSTQVNGQVVTAVGEVPPATVREIATSLAPVEPPDSVGGP
jgi:sigma-E factor negative regulatory protein RseB